MFEPKKGVAAGLWIPRFAKGPKSAANTDFPAGFADSAPAEGLIGCADFSKNFHAIFLTGLDCNLNSCYNKSRS